MSPTPLRQTWKHPVWSFLVAASFLGPFMLGFLGRLPRVDVRIKMPESAEGSYHPSYRRTGGPQLVMIYVGKSKCYWSNQDWLPETIERAKLALQATADDEGWTFNAVGVAVDWRVQDGLDHLAKFGLFDEVMTGASWGNSDALKFIWQDHPGEAATPEVVIFRRDLTVPDTTLAADTYEEHGGRVLMRIVGAAQIRAWTERGAPIPR